MFFIYQDGALELIESSEDKHTLKVDDKYYVFYDEDLNLLKTLIEENCSTVNKNKILKDKSYKKVNSYYLDKNNITVALESVGNDVFDMRNKDAVNWIVKTFVEKFNNKYKNKKLNITYPENPYDTRSPHIYVPSQPYIRDI